ncbi:MAG: NUDIX domain-containing protein [Parcubacteria group bacterium]|nr:NUDIX domain-containing protein [Parcubacteria group bacterium]
MYNKDMEPIPLPYTICFCFSGEEVLLLHRKFAPNKGLWNGLGGKIEKGEVPRAAIIREFKEESGIDLSQNSSLSFAGLVTWTWSENGISEDKGMYAYVAELPVADRPFVTLETAEGRLEWRDLTWATDSTNRAIADNLPYFLPQMAKGDVAAYHCYYVDGHLLKVETIKSPNNQAFQVDLNKSS